MKPQSIKINAASLIRAVKFAALARKGPTTLPILSNALLRCRDLTLTIACTNLDQWASASIPCEPGDWEFTVPASYLERALARVGEEAELTLEGEILKVSGNGATFKLAGLSAGEFPNIPEVTGAEWPVVGKDLARMIDRLLPFVSSGEQRLALEGIYYSPTGQWVATNGRAMALEMEVKRDTPGFIIPTDALAAIREICTRSAGGPVTMVCGHGARFACAGYSFSTKLIDARFPNYEQIIPRKYKIAATLDREGLIELMSGVKAMRGPMDDSAFRMHFTKDTLAASWLGKVHSYEATMPAKCSHELKIALNDRLLFDAIKGLDCKEITLESYDEMSPLKICYEGFLAVIMPMRVS